MRNDRMQEGSTAVALAMVTPGYDQDPASGVADYASHQDQAQFEADKRAVYKHPLFPLLALLFERCEQATQTSDNSNSESFNMDIQAFVQHQERDRKPFLINDPEIDGLMIKAIQVLRIHLLELEKVQELCKDFCNRYITCLKGKMQSENLLRSDYSQHGSAHHDGIVPPSSGSNGSSPLQVLSSAGNDVESGANGLRVSRDSEDLESSDHGVSLVVRPTSTLLDEQHLQQQRYRPPSSRSSCSSNGGGIGAQNRSSLDRPETDFGDEHLRSSDSPRTVHGGTPLSQIGAHSQTPINDIYLGQDITVAGSPSSMQSEDEDEVAAAAGVGSLTRRKVSKPKRGILPKQATNIMRAWLFQHLVHPYPTEDEKRQIANETNLTLLQVNNWFINARRRILQPMIDGAGVTEFTPQTQQQQRQQEQQQQNNESFAPSKAQTHQQSKVESHARRQHEHQADWQSDDSGSESNGSSDADANHGLVIDDLRGTVSHEESEDGGIEVEESKVFSH
ncbi:hypothetical protein QAD02_023747 [Eretmocerus hayati]|uniref:Uncharacterized protein n=1 Tax=Eretmocerus hayati TaxID=131215 RepID=A0ACC2PWV2_9HYME|nr:hypothetical protein QAD02_023747 [Eretmocerus hayati]